jgi:hypothetical protein
MNAREYARHFVRVMHAPWDASDEDIAALTPADQDLYADAVDAALHELDNHERRILGMKPRPSPTRLLESRMTELCAAARRPDFSLTDIPAGEWRRLCANPDQLAALERALGEGLAA